VKKESQVKSQKGEVKEESKGEVLKDKSPDSKVKKESKGKSPKGKVKEESKDELLNEESPNGEEKKKQRDKSSKRKVKQESKDEVLKDKSPKGKVKKGSKNKPQFRRRRSQSWDKRKEKHLLKPKSPDRRGRSKSGDMREESKDDEVKDESKVAEVLAVEQMNAKNNKIEKALSELDALIVETDEIIATAQEAGIAAEHKKDASVNQAQMDLIEIGTLITKLMKTVKSLEGTDVDTKKMEKVLQRKMAMIEAYKIESALLKKASDDVMVMDRRQFAELRMMKNPKPPLKNLLRAIAIIFGVKYAEKEGNRTGDKNVRSFIASSGIQQKILKLSPSDLKKKQVWSVMQFLDKHPEVTRQKVYEINSAIAVVEPWLRMMIKLGQRLLFGGQSIEEIIEETKKLQRTLKRRGHLRSRSRTLLPKAVRKERDVGRVLDRSIKTHGKRKLRKPKRAVTDKEMNKYRNQVRKRNDKDRRAVRQEAQRKERLRREKMARAKAQREAHERERRKLKEKAERKVREDARRRARERAERMKREAAEKKRRADALKRKREKQEREMRERAERKKREKAEREARERAEREARKARRLAREKAERERLEREAREREARRKREKAEREARERAEREQRQQTLRDLREAFQPDDDKDRLWWEKATTLRGKGGGIPKEYTQSNWARRQATVRDGLTSKSATERAWSPRDWAARTPWDRPGKKPREAGEREPRQPHPKTVRTRWEKPQKKPRVKGEREPREHPEPKKVGWKMPEKREPKKGERAPRPDREIKPVEPWERPERPPRELGKRQRPERSKTDRIPWEKPDREPKKGERDPRARADTEREPWPKPERAPRKGEHTPKERIDPVVERPPRNRPEKEAKRSPREKPDAAVARPPRERPIKVGERAPREKPDAAVERPPRERPNKERERLPREKPDAAVERPPRERPNKERERPPREMPDEEKNRPPRDRPDKDKEKKKPEKPEQEKEQEVPKEPEDEGEKKPSPILPPGLDEPNIKPADVDFWKKIQEVKRRALFEAREEAIVEFSYIDEEGYTVTEIIETVETVNMMNGTAGKELLMNESERFIGNQMKEGETADFSEETDDFGRQDETTRTDEGWEDLSSQVCDLTSVLKVLNSRRISQKQYIENMQY